MRKLFFLILIFSSSARFAFANPELTTFSVGSNFLQSGKIKVYDNGSTEFLATIGASRAYSPSGYENVQMEVTIYAVLNNIETNLKVINITSSQFDGPWLAYYNEDPASGPSANNVVKIAIPESLKDSQIRIKYRYKDAANNWQPNYSPNYFMLSTVYNTINVSPLPVKMPIYLVSHKGNNKYQDIFQLQNSYATPFGWNYGGIDFKAYTSVNSVSRLGAVPIYQYKYKVIDQSTGGQGDPSEIFFYSPNTSISPTPFPGYSYQLESSIVAFYAFNTQVSGTIPVYKCSHKNAPIQVYLSSDADINDGLYNTQIAFYAYHYDAN
ncbi:hypothetical protein ABIB40_001949 [Pedobacter sp. UYP30]|uniref:hypothetical protein n=1 Tax=Pedobacter sp. UYP30 TaxID=1756400 RepID=UPI003394D35F